MGRLLEMQKLLFLDNIICGEKRVNNFLLNIYNFFVGSLSGKIIQSWDKKLVTCKNIPMRN